MKQVAGPGNVAITTDFVGVQGSATPSTPSTCSPAASTRRAAGLQLKPGAPLRGEELKERLRKAFREGLPEVAFSFEAGDIISQVMSFGSPTPIEVDVQGPNQPANRAHAARVFAELGRLPELRDLQYAQPLDYPTLDVNIDRDRAGQYGLTMADVARSLVAATSSSRFIDPNYWRDPRSGNAFQIQVEIPQHKVASLEDLQNLPVMPEGAAEPSAHPLVGDVAQLKYGTAPGRGGSLQHAARGGNHGEHTRRAAGQRCSQGAGRH